MKSIVSGEKKRLKAKNLNLKIFIYIQITVKKERRLEIKNVQIIY